jgi:hypothetical protein
MAGTKVGGIRAAETNKRKYGPNFYKNIGSKGGIVQTKKGFALMSAEKVSAAGRKGGAISRRTKKEEK